MSTPDGDAPFSKEKRMVKKRFQTIIGSVFASALLLSACNENSPTAQEKSGTFKATLMGVSTQGYTYRLRQAAFQITGPENLNVSSEDYLNDDAIVLTLAVGAYQIQINSDWFLERVDTLGATRVEAVLTSESTVPFDILEFQTTGVLFLFRVGDDIIPIGNGELTIQIGIDDEGFCVEDAVVTYSGSELPAEIAGQYVEAFDCSRDEGGAWFGEVDYAHCFRKSDESTWRIWNTGCGWEYGLIAPVYDWNRHALTYAGMCSDIPESQLGIEALTTQTFYNGFGDPITGLSSTCNPSTTSQCADITISYTGTELPSDIAGQYVEAFDCSRDEGGAWFGEVDYAHCFRKNDGSNWRIWNTGCGWEYGLNVVIDTEWQRHARTYTGQCSEIPESQLGIEALTTQTFYDGFGDPIVGLTSLLCD
jgi:hypothetical protein